ncbi:paramyosin [Scaptodrosophila lebanonensis]|uniref:Paramyosin n=1 Tax=Drosophila lebanonensis TaxID=7225 RepID=A0A6J2THE5_DROLE|nr:paramyosin [Scaptodrosophila lebanonensis]
MDSNTPGVSLFEAAEPLKINSTLDRQEEEEMLQDQKRREEELGNLLENAFDDLDDDDNDDNESTIGSTSNFHSDILPPKLPVPESVPSPLPLPLPMPNHHLHQQQPWQGQHHQQELQNANYDTEIHNLKMMLESKTHEVNNINQRAKDMHKKCDEYQKRLTITEAELERALREKQHTHELLVDSKEKCSNLDSIIEKLRGEKRDLESENNQLAGQLETAQSLLADVQRKYDMVERDFHKRDDRTAEFRVKQLEEKQRAQMELMQQQLSQMSDQLDKKKQELDTMHTRYNALQSSHETMLLDKAGKINELNSALDVAQRRFNQLAAKPNYETEYLRQQQCIADLHAQVASMEQTIATLNERLNGTTAELDLMDTLLQQHQTDDTPGGRLSQVQPGRLVGSTPLDTVDRIGHIKTELYRALGNLKQKREEVRKLEKQLEERQCEVRTLREQENKSLVLVATIKEEKMRLESRIKMLESELVGEQHKSLNESKLSALQKELDVLQAQRESLQQERALQALERKEIEERLSNVQLDLEQHRQEHDSLKRNYEQLQQDNRQLRSRATADSLRLELERHKILLKDAQSEVERLKKLYADIANEKEAMSYQLLKLRDSDSIKELQEQREQVASLQRTLQLAELKSEELAKILETEKLCHERELQALRQKTEQERQAELKAAREKNEQNCSKCMDHLAEITKAEIQMLKMNNVNTMQRKQLEDLTREVQESKELQRQLEDKIALAEKQERLITELKTKAAEFEEYIKLHCSPAEREGLNSITSPKLTPQSAAEVSSSAAPTPNPTASPGGGDADSPNAMNQARIKRIEQRVRDEMAKLFAVELKRFMARLQQTEEKSLCLQREYKLVTSELQQRQNEVELLKQTILAEREKIEEILANKDQSHQAALEKQKVMLQMCRNDLHAKNQRIAELINELQERHETIESERQSMKAVMTQWEEHRKSVNQVENEWRNKLETLRETHEEAMRAAQMRYQSAKRTAQNYKIYAEDKEAHMKREYERIKAEYELSLAKIEMTMNQRLEHKSRELAASNTPQTTSTLPTGTASKLSHQHKQKDRPHSAQVRDKENLPSNK